MRHPYSRLMRVQASISKNFSLIKLVFFEKVLPPGKDKNKKTGWIIGDFNLPP